MKQKHTEVTTTTVTVVKTDIVLGDDIINYIYDQYVIGGFFIRNMLLFSSTCKKYWSKVEKNVTSRSFTDDLITKNTDQWRHTTNFVYYSQVQVIKSLQLSYAFRDAVMNKIKAHDVSEPSHAGYSVIHKWTSLMDMLISINYILHDADDYKIAVKSESFCVPNYDEKDIIRSSRHHNAVSGTVVEALINIDSYLKIFHNASLVFLDKSDTYRSPYTFINQGNLQVLVLDAQPVIISSNAKEYKTQSSQQTFF